MNEDVKNPEIPIDLSHGISENQENSKYLNEHNLYISSNINTSDSYSDPLGYLMSMV